MKKAALFENRCLGLGGGLSFAGGVLYLKARCHGSYSRDTAKNHSLDNVWSAA